MKEWEWPGVLPDLTGFPVLHVTVTSPHDQASLHRDMARLGYTMELIFADLDGEHWQFWHPDGERPS